MAKKDITFMELGYDERKILLMALGLKSNDLHCYYCNKKINYKICSIMPALKRTENCIILCNNPLCLCEYLTKQEKK